MQTITKQQGGKVEAKGAANVPRDRQQIANFRPSVAKPKDSNVLYSIMVECKLAQGKSDAFIRDVKAAPEPQSVMFFGWQLDDVCFRTNSQQLSVMSIDTTFNLGEFYVAPITYRHHLLEGVCSGKPPIMIGPLLVHQHLQFCTYNYFLSTLVGYNNNSKLSWRSELMETRILLILAVITSRTLCSCIALFTLSAMSMRSSGT